MAHYSEVDNGDSIADYTAYSGGRGYSAERRANDASDHANGGFYQRRVKRMLDVFIIILAAPIVLPIIAMFAFFVRRDGGPAFYSQDRIGRNGEAFRCWKLRSMTVDADAFMTTYLAQNPAAHAEWERTQKLKLDPRITPLGRFLRKASLDELPQLWNVIRGDMSLVGPRPMMPDQRPLYPGRAYYRLRPGLTGFWQISDRNATSFSHRAVYDTRYAQRLSLMTDLGVLLMTVRSVLRGTGY